MDCCDDLQTMMEDDYESVHGIAYWNSTLFVIGHRRIYYTTMKLYDTNYAWNSFIYNNISELFIVDVDQYKSSLYILAADITAIEPDQLFYFDLDKPMNQTERIMIPEYKDGLQIDALSSSDFMVVAENTVYVVISTYILIYGGKNGWYHWYRSHSTLDGVESHLGDVLDLVIWPTPTKTGGALTNDGKYIYIFTDDQDDRFWKYDIRNDSFWWINASNICFSQDVSSITAPNGKMYIDGCYISSWKAAILDAEIPNFKTETVDIDNPINRLNQRNNHLAVFDDNILLLYSNNQQFNLYFTVTNDISINISNTITTLWPSDGILFEYYLNDFSEKKQGRYELYFDFNATEGIRKTVIVFDTAKDHCICDGYNCHECNHYFNLSQHLTTADNGIDRILCNLAVTDANMDILLLPDTISIKLERCKIEFANTKFSTNSDNPLIRFTFHLDEICNLRLGVNYSLSIISEQVKIDKNMIISIIDNNTNIAWICDSGVESVSQCPQFYNGLFEFYHPTLDVNNETAFYIELISNSIDLKIKDSSKHFPMAYLPTKTDTRWNKNYWWFLLLLLIPVFIASLWYYKARKKYGNAFKVNKALVLIIGISQFDEKNGI